MSKEQFKIKNGPTIIFDQNNDWNKCYFGIHVPYGSNNIHYLYNGKRYNTKLGLAHFIEHKLFEMKDDEDASILLSHLGADSNAFTTYDSTSYFFTCSRNVLSCSKVLLDMVFNREWTNESIEKEKKIIIEELRMYADYPDYKLQNHLLKSLFPNHPFSNDIGGTIQEVSHTKKKDLDQAYDVFYRPDTMVITVLGKFQIQKMKQLLLFYPYPNKAKEGPTTIYEANSYNNRSRLHTIQSNIHCPTVLFGYRFPVIENVEERKKLDLLFSIWLNAALGDSSPLIKDLREKNLINDSFEYTVLDAKTVRFLSFQTETNEPQRTYKAFMKLSKELMNYSISNEEFERQKKCFIGVLLSQFDDLSTKGYQYFKSSIENVDLNQFHNEIDQLKYEDLHMVYDFVKKGQCQKFMTLPKDVNKVE